jgi:hypothetical protein
MKYISMKRHPKGTIPGNTRLETRTAKVTRVYIEIYYDYIILY